jgi:hypothetical protein
LAIINLLGPWFFPTLYTILNLNVGGKLVAFVAAFHLNVLTRTFVRTFEEMADEKAPTAFTIKKIIIKVIDKKTGKFFYRVRWDGYESDQDTFEPAESFLTSDVLERFEKEFAAAGKPCHVVDFSKNSKSSKTKVRGRPKKLVKESKRTPLSDSDSDYAEETNDWSQIGKTKKFQQSSSKKSHNVGKSSKDANAMNFFDSDVSDFECANDEIKTVNTSNRKNTKQTVGRPRNKRNTGVGKIAKTSKVLSTSTTRSKKAFSKSKRKTSITDDDELSDSDYDGNSTNSGSIASF